MELAQTKKAINNLICLFHGVVGALWTYPAKWSLKSFLYCNEKAEKCFGKFHKNESR